MGAGMLALSNAFARLAASLAVIALGALGVAGAADAASFTVDSAADAPLAVSSSTTCTSTGGGTCTLRAAVQAANNAGGSNTISLPAGEYKLSIPGSGEEEPENGDLDVIGSTTAITITGAGSGATSIGTTVASRLLRVHYAASLTLVGVALVGGESEAGGAVLNEGALTIRQSALTKNSSTGFGGAIDSSTSATSTTIEGSTAEKNIASDGGVIRADGGTVTLIGDRVHDNTATAYGGVLAEEQEEPAAVVIDRSTLSGNEAALNGGALALEAGEQRNRTGHLTVLDSTFDEDTAEQGGAIFESYDDEEIKITRSEFDHDQATAGDGGAIYEAETPVDNVAESTFEHDSGTLGGALYSAVSDPAVSRSRFAVNTAKEGGAVFLNDYAGSEPTLTTSTLDDNHASARGGGIFRQEGRLKLTASTLDGNTANLLGGGAYIEGEEPAELVNDTLQGNESLLEGGALYLQSYVALLNDTIARNTSESGGGIAHAGRVNSAADTIIAFNSGADCLESIPEEAEPGGDIDGDGTCFHRRPLGNHTEVTEEELKLGTLGEHGGFTETIPLGAGSVALADGVIPCAPTDERGFVRPEHCDPGAYEVGNYVAPPLPSIEGGTAEPHSTTARVTAQVNPNGPQVTSCEVEYGLEGAFEYAVPCSPVPGSGDITVTVEGSLDELVSGARYQYRVVVANANGVADGPTSTFATSSEETTTPRTTPSGGTSTRTTARTPTSTTASKSAAPKPCVSRRVEAITWRVPAGTHLRRILVMLAGRRYRTLDGGARRTDVSFVGLRRRTVVVKIIGIAASGRRHTAAFTFHTCVPDRRGSATPGVPYLRA
jgi:CSLREA domain-containing protein